MDIKHFDQEPRRKAEFFMPKNALKEQVGTGGLSDEVLMRAQRIFDNHTEDFRPLAEVYLDNIKESMDEAKKAKDDSNSEELITNLLMPCVQLKSNGTMFHYPLITRVANRFIEFMEVIDSLDPKAIEIVGAFHSTIKIILAEQIKDSSAPQGEALVEELNSACMRYFEKKKNN